MKATTTRRDSGDDLIEVRADDLRFTQDEVATYLKQVAGLDLSATNVAVLDARTEGWIVGLQMAALSMQGREDIFVHDRKNQTTERVSVASDGSSEHSINRTLWPAGCGYAFTRLEMPVRIRRRNDRCCAAPCRGCPLPPL